MAIASDDKIIYGAFFFIDIVGLSDPSMSTATQLAKIKALNKCVFESDSFRSTSRKDLLVLPTGDGMAIAFFKDLGKPVQLAREVQSNLRQYNAGKEPIDMVKVRIGCNEGHVFVVSDVNGNQNIWGPGIVIARRIMDLGDADHILITSETAETLRGISDEYGQLIHPVHDFQIKHNQQILVYSIYGKDFGNPSRPSKAVVTESKLTSKAKATQNDLHVDKIELRYILEDPGAGALTQKTIYRVTSTAKEPIFMLYEMIAELGIPISEIDLEAHDEDENPLKIQEIVSDTVERKEIIIKLSRPILPYEKGRFYEVIYKIKEPSAKHRTVFSTSADELLVSFEVSVDKIRRMDPRLYMVRNQSETSAGVPAMLTMRNTATAKWTMGPPAPVRAGDSIRLEW